MQICNNETGPVNKSFTFIFNRFYFNVLSTIVCFTVSYRLFLHSVLSALLGVCLVLVVASYVFVEFFVDPSRLRTDQHFLCKS